MRRVITAADYFAMWWQDVAAADHADYERARVFGRDRQANAYADMRAHAAAQQAMVRGFSLQGDEP